MPCCESPFTSFIPQCLSFTGPFRPSGALIEFIIHVLNLFFNRLISQKKQEVGTIFFSFPLNFPSKFNRFSSFFEYIFLYLLLSHLIFYFLLFCSLLLPVFHSTPLYKKLAYLHRVHFLSSFRSKSLHCAGNLIK